MLKQSSSIFTYNFFNRQCKSYSPENLIVVLPMENLTKPLKPHELWEEKDHTSAN